MSYVRLADLQSKSLEVKAVDGGASRMCEDFVGVVLNIRKEIFHAGILTYNGNGTISKDDDNGYVNVMLRIHHYQYWYTHATATSTALIVYIYTVVYSFFS